MRLAAYAGASTVLAAGVILRAFHERPNFYSAAVYLGQSNACRMILLNMLLLTAGASMYVLQRLFYGPLRAIEIEQLWDKAWYAITETALAMTTFRDEVGGWFFIMFVSLLAGKVWGWISEGRVDIMEQQPPANPRLFHARLMASLLLSETFDLLMLRYCLQTLAAQPRPGMMVMFAFEFAVLAIASSSTTIRYALHLQEKIVIKRQTQLKVEERREEIRNARREAQAQDTQDATTTAPSNLPREEEIDENEIDVPGWQEKGRYILFLDLATDFMKLVLYLGFFMVLLLFSGIPVHMFRDLFITSRSFVKRINDYFKYRNATKDMNARYPDATLEDLERENTCIICREEMRVWQAPAQHQAAEGQQRIRSPPDERQRPKKLPCGHILHFGCLRSWLERQQVCPTCRRSVLVEGRQPPPSGSQAPANNGQPGQQQGPGQPNQNRNVANQRPPQQNGLRARTFNLGNIRLTFATGNPQNIQNALQQLRQQQHNGAQNTQQTVENQLTTGLNNLQGRQNETTSGSLQEQLGHLERQVAQEISNLNMSQQQLVVVRALQQELSRLQQIQTNPAQPSNAAPSGQLNMAQAAQVPMFQMPMGVPVYGHQLRPMNILHPYQPLQYLQNAPQQQHVLVNRGQSSALGPGHPNLPQGLILPEGWSMLPLHSVDPSGTGQQAVQPSTRGVGTEVTPISQISVDTSDPRFETGNVTPNLQATDNNREGNASSNPCQATIASSTGTAAGNASQVPHGESDPSPTPLPNWSNAQALEAAETSDNHVGSNEAAVNEGEGDHSQASGSASVDKGKGKAVTVEDVEDEEG